MAAGEQAPGTVQLGDAATAIHLSFWWKICGHFDAIWASTSNFVHAHPASYSRSEAPFVERTADKLNFENQFLHMYVFFDYCTGWLELVLERTFLLYPELLLKEEEKH